MKQRSNLNDIGLRMAAIITLLHCLGPQLFQGAGQPNQVDKVEAIILGFASFIKVQAFINLGVCWSSIQKCIATVSSKMDNDLTV